MNPRRTRLAPSPTGALHLGNIRTFLVTWALARRHGWAIDYRTEDLDGPRVKPGAAAQVASDLRWLGLDWDRDHGRQSEDLEPMHEAMRRLAERGLVFASDATRREIEAAASAPHAGDAETRFPESLRPAPGDRDWGFVDPARAHRLRVDPGSRTVNDRVRGTRTLDVSADVGDFLIWTKQGLPSYQLAVVVDDARQGVTDVVRGDDLLPSAARQALLHEHLGAREPAWWHLPLVVGPDGRRLAKRHGDTRLARYRDAGVSPERLVGWAAATCGLPGPRRPCSAADFLAAFDPDALPRSPVVVTEEDDRWLSAR